MKYTKQISILKKDKRIHIVNKIVVNLKLQRVRILKSYSNFNYIIFGCFFFLLEHKQHIFEIEKHLKCYLK